MVDGGPSRSCLEVAGLALNKNPGGPSIQIRPILMENQMDKKMQNEMDTAVTKGLHRDPIVQIVLTLGPQVCKQLPRLGYLDP